MASLHDVIDNDAELPGTFEVFEAGNYKMHLIESDIVPTKKGDGKLLKYRVEITEEGELNKRLIFGQFNLTNPNPVAAKIGQGEFKALRELVGVPEPDDTSDLHFREFVGVVKITPAKTTNGTTYDAKNEIDWGKSHKLAFDSDAPTPSAANDNKATPVVSKTTVTALANSGGPKKPAWPKKAA